MVEMKPDTKRIERFTFDEVCQFNATKAELEKKKVKLPSLDFTFAFILFCPFHFSMIKNYY